MKAISLLIIATFSLPAAIRQVPPGTWQDIQAALDSAQPGDILEFEAGAEYRAGVDPFELRKSGTPERWITVRSTRWRDLRPGYRIAPDDTELLPKICTPSTANQGAIRTDNTAANVPIHHWKFQALWFTVCGAGQNSAGDLLVIGNSESERRPDQISHHFIFDQVLITGHDDHDVGPKRGLLLNVGAAEVLNSYIGNIKGTVIDGSETHALGGWIGAGITVRNTRISSASENFLFGGARAPWPGFTSTNIQLIGNLLEKDLDWNYINWPHGPREDALPPCIAGAAPQTVIVADKMYVCSGTSATAWFQVAWDGTKQPECLSDETGGVHWRDTREYPSKTYDCVNGKWQGPMPDRMHPVTRNVTDVTEGVTTKLISSAGISNIDWNVGTWVRVANSVTCPQLDGAHRIDAVGGNGVTIAVDSTSCGNVSPSGMTLQFQFSNWDTKNMGEFKNNLGAEVRGNIFRNCLFPTWQSQKCRSFLLNLTGEQDGPTSTLSEISFLNNKFYNAAGGIDEGAILCGTNNKVIASKIIRGNPTQLLDSACHFLVGDNIKVVGAPTTGPWAALNGWHPVISLGSPGFGGDAFIPLDSTTFPAPNFDVSVEMDLASFGPNRASRDIYIANNIFKMGHPNTFTGGFISGAKQFSSYYTSTYWYSLDIGRVAYVLFSTSLIHNSFIKPEFGMGYSLHGSLIPGPLLPEYGSPKPKISNRDNIYEGHFIQGYVSEGPCSKAMEIYTKLPAKASGNIATRPTNNPSGNPPSGYDKNGCETTWLAPADSVGYEDYYKDNFRLAATSKYKGAATDGSDPGADQNVVDWETAGAVSGAPNPYLDMTIKNIALPAVEYLAYSTALCTVVASERRGGAGLSASIVQDGRRGIATFDGLQSATHYWLRLTCEGKYRDQDFATYAGI